MRTTKTRRVTDAVPVADRVRCVTGTAVAGRVSGATAAPIRPRAGLTLIEVLVVIVVLGVLATLVAPNVFRHVGASKEATARSQIELLGAALDAYRLDNDRYPTTSQGLEALRREPLSEPRPRNWRGPYLRKEVPDDPWDNAYIYRSPGTESTWGYDLSSHGRDGRPGGTGEDADIHSWE